MHFGPLALKALRKAMIDAGLARTTINQRVGRIVRLFKWAVENEGWVPPAIHRALKADSRDCRRAFGRRAEPEAGRAGARGGVEAIRPGLCYVAPTHYVLLTPAPASAIRS